MVSASEASLSSDMMLGCGAAAPTTVMGQIMGALNTGLSEDLNIETLEHGFDCNVDEVRSLIELQDPTLESKYIMDVLYFIISIKYTSSKVFHTVTFLLNNQIIQIFLRRSLNMSLVWTDRWISTSLSSREVWSPRGTASSRHQRRRRRCPCPPRARLPTTLAPLTRPPLPGSTKSLTSSFRDQVAI